MIAEKAAASTARPLSGLAIGISISDAEPQIMARIGLKPSDINQVTVELCRRFVALGARLVLGHNWRPGGIMEAISSFAQVYQPESTGPIIRNFLAYPDRAALSDPDRLALKPLVDIVEDSNPDHLSRPEALRRMREEMAEVCHARVCLCGRVTQFQGSVPGLVEEVAMTLVRGRPVYISAAMSGVAELLARFILGERGVFESMPEAFASVAEQTAGWVASPEFEERLGQLSEFSISRLAMQCGLTEDELRELLLAQNLDTVVQLASKGLANLRPRFQG